MRWFLHSQGFTYGRIPVPPRSLCGCTADFLIGIKLCKTFFIGPEVSYEDLHKSSGFIHRYVAVPLRII
jgi:hypothetical protein